MEPFCNNDPSRALSLAVGSVGLLETLHFIDDAVHQTVLSPCEVEVQVHAAGLSFKDVMVAMGQLPDSGMGLECAGTVTRVGTQVDQESQVRVGDRVCCLASGTFKTFARTNVDLVARVPETMSFVEAAALPVAYLMAYYALMEVARLQEDETVLIHAGAGGVGQAAIQVATRVVGVDPERVFVTVSTDDKKDVLVREYGIPASNIFSSRKLSFAAGIQRLTAGRGCDVVLNSLVGDALRETWRNCVAPMGRFIEVGGRDIRPNESLPMSGFGTAKSFTALDLNLMLQARTRLAGNILQKVLDLAQNGTLKPPVPLHRIPVGDVQDAFSGLVNGRLVGKAVIDMRAEDNNTVPVSLLMLTSPCTIRLVSYAVTNVWCLRSSSLTSQVIHSMLTPAT